MAATSEKEAMVDPFLVEALQNPRHRLTILRMELDIQKFFQSPEQQQFEFQPLPTSYLRLIAHRVTQHYGLFTTALDGGSVDGSENRILATKTTESRFPYVCLSEIPVKQPETNRPQGFKIAIKPRPNRGSGGLGSGSRVEKNLLRSVEERKEEYERARARIFNSASSSDSEDSSTRALPPSPHLYTTKHDNTRPTRNETEVVINSSTNPVDVERNGVNRESGRTSRVAIIRDREKDRYDPDYDRNRYVRVTPPVQNYNPIPIQLQFHDSAFPPMPRTQATVNYGHPFNPAMSNFSTQPLNQASGNAPSYTEWPSVSATYAHTLNASETNLFRHPNP